MAFVCQIFTVKHGFANKMSTLIAVSSSQNLDILMFTSRCRFASDFVDQPCYFGGLCGAKFTIAEVAKITVVFNILLNQ